MHIAGFWGREAKTDEARKYFTGHEGDRENVLLKQAPKAC